jgi:NADH-quinone oxidoreductase subunit M
MGGLGTKLPALGFLFGLAGMASVGLPLLANFAGEFSIFVSCFAGWTPAVSTCDCWLGAVANFFGGMGPVQLATIGALWGLVISAIYMLRAFRNIFEGPVGKTTERATSLTVLDIVAACFLAVFIVLFGIVPPTCL